MHTRNKRALFSPNRDAPLIRPISFTQNKMFVFLCRLYAFGVMPFLSCCFENSLIEEHRWTPKHGIHQSQYNFKQVRSCQPISDEICHHLLLYQNVLRYTDQITLETLPNSVILTLHAAVACAFEAVLDFLVFDCFRLFFCYYCCLLLLWPMLSGNFMKINRLEANQIQNVHTYVLSVILRSQTHTVDKCLPNSYEIARILFCRFPLVRFFCRSNRYKIRRKLWQLFFQYSSYFHVSNM